LLNVFLFYFIVCLSDLSFPFVRSFTNGIPTTTPQRAEIEVVANNDAAAAPQNIQVHNMATMDVCIKTI
jgi:hypothetical protein